MIGQASDSGKRKQTS